MRAVTIAAAGAALLSTVSASSHVQQVHKQLHARSGWADWKSGTDPASTPADMVKSTPTPVEEEPSDETADYGNWGSSSTPAEDPEETTTYGDWGSSSTPEAETTTSYDPATISWEDWSSSTPVADATTSSEDPSSTWADWTTSSTPEAETTTSYDPATISWEDWSSTSTPVEETTTSSEDPSHTWADWSSSSTPADETTTSYDPSTVSWEDWSSSSPVEITSTESADPSTTWGDWDASSTPADSTVYESGTTTTTVYLGKPSDPSTWADWSSSTPADATTSSAPAWSSDGWFGPGWNTDDGQCAFQVVTSYGSATWSPTPEATSSMPVLSVTVQPTESTTWADWSATSSDPAAETDSSTWADWSATTSSEPADETTASSTWADWSATSSDPSVETTASSTSWADWSQETGLGGEGKNTWGMTYSPYTNEGGCKDASTVSSDLSVIKSKGFSTVRVYSTDCSTLENVGSAAKDLGLKLILGVFISNTGIEGSKEQVWDIIGWKQWDLVELIVIGNEAVFNGYCSASDLAAYITESANYFKQAGYTGPVTTTEPLAEWLKDGSTFCSVVDVVAANLYAFFNAETTADKAGDFIQAQIGDLSQVCPGKDTYVMESGWPSAGDCNGAACPSPENQATAIKSIESVTGSKVIFFSYEDEGWKQPGEFNVEQHWGCADVF